MNFDFNIQLPYDNSIIVFPLFVVSRIRVP